MKAYEEAQADPTKANTTAKQIYDPKTQRFSDNPNYVAPVAPIDTSIGMFGYDYGYGGAWNGGNQNDGNGGGNDGGNSGAGAGDGAGEGGSGASHAMGGLTKRMNTGGITSIPTFQDGGDMASDAFVVPADVVSALGNGSTDAGIRALNDYLGEASHIKGSGDGLSDDVPATIEGDQPARVADGEAYIDPQTVSSLGGGDAKKGAAKLYAMMDQIRKAAHGKTSQQKEVNPKKVMPA
jgi:hypothetical protein